MANSNLRRNRGGGAGGGGAGGDQVLLHSPDVAPAVPRLETVPGSIRGNVALSASDVSAFQAITDGTLTIGSETLTGIDLSSEASIPAVVAALNLAIGTNAALSSYSVTFGFINPSFYGILVRSDGNVEQVTGTIAPLMGWNTPAETVQHAARSSFLVFPERAGGGDWQQLLIRAQGQSYTGQYWHFIGDFWMPSGGGDPVSHYLAFDNRSEWAGATFNGAGNLAVGVIEAYGVMYYSILYDNATRTLSWQTETTAPTALQWNPSVDTLMVLAR